MPWGAELTVTVVDTGEATQIDATGPAYDAARGAFAEAWDGTEPVDMGVGGSIPFIAEFLEAFPQASVLVTGVEDPDTRAHGANEGLHLAEFERVVLAEALLLQRLGQSLIDPAPNPGRARRDPGLPRRAPARPAGGGHRPPGRHHRVRQPRLPLGRRRARTTTCAPPATTTSSGCWSCWRRRWPTAGGLPGRRVAADPAYDAARATGRRRAEQGLPLDDVLRSFRLGGRLIWEDLVEQAAVALEAEDLREVGTRLWEVVDETSAQVAAAYHLAERAAVRADEQLRAELWEGVLSGRAKEPGFAHEAARILDVPVDARLPRGHRCPTSTRRGPRPSLQPRATTWVRRSGGAVGLVALRRDDPQDVRRGAARPWADRVAARRGLGGGPRPGRGRHRLPAGRRGAAHPGGRRGLAAFDDRLPEALLLSAARGGGPAGGGVAGPAAGAAGGRAATPLVATLEAWVATGGSTTHTGQRVHCHRNTVINRLRRVATLTGRDLLDAGPPVELALALRALRAGLPPWSQPSPTPRS